MEISLKHDLSCCLQLVGVSAVAGRGWPVGHLTGKLWIYICVCVCMMTDTATAPIDLLTIWMNNIPWTSAVAEGLFHPIIISCCESDWQFTFYKLLSSTWNPLSGGVSKQHKLIMEFKNNIFIYLFIYSYTPVGFHVEYLHEIFTCLSIRSHYVVWHFNEVKQ